jgi:N-hydroxyarylamine O-acetyltransferase
VSGDPPAPRLAPALAERVLLRLGLPDWPAPTPEGLALLYAAWCAQVPFDNVRKLIALHTAQSGPLPGSEAADFFEHWLRDGTGGTCWAGNGAMHALLQTLGFASSRAVATMRVNPSARANHGTVLVACAGGRYLLDASMLHGQPVLLDEAAPPPLAEAPWAVRALLEKGRWLIRWRPLHRLTGLDCCIEWPDATLECFHALHEKTRPWSPFNYSLYGRRNRAAGVIGVAFGKRIEFRAAGTVDESPLDAQQRIRFVVEELGISEALAHALPPDIPTPAAQSVAGGSPAVLSPGRFNR